ncbi:class I adenylate-forming enzyme family protein [Celeribacter sp. PS-C1]|uniref:class I adenylate-forming enzyme family protein n=1 Tax=Celeribacter sp. PS-C1 TaxID=2820813 RepID=UPI001C678D1B|nr:long-chain fatty acid--CoA ligase [Celeribacter sp. PS-C1]MBW6419744.1 long-chain fatty acid--CoA ligase [Celeribacter sp. PS-C1]
MIWHRFLQVAQAHAHATAVIGEDETLTYADFVARVNVEAGKLPRRADMGRPARVLLVPTEPATLLLRVFACWSRGLVPVVLREGQTEESLKRISGIAEPVLILSDTTPQHPQHVSQEDAPPFTARDEALVMCTSGTTGTPKLVALPAEGVLATASAIADDLGFSEGDIIAVPTPLTYMYGLMGASVTGLLSGAALRLFVPGAPLTVVQSAIRREKITVMQGPPSLMRLFLAYWGGEPFDSVRLVTTGGEYMTSEMVTDLAKAFPQSQFRLLYGMTEAGPRISHCQSVTEYKGGLCVGVPFDHFEWRVVPVEQEGLPSGAGRLALRGPSVCLGYIQPENKYAGVDTDGYFTSTDIVCTVDDASLCFFGRQDRLFKTGGKLINPLEIEALLMRHPDVRDAVCHAEDHRLLGLVPVAQVVLKEGAQTDSATLIAHCAVLETHAVPHRIDILRALCISASGKRVVATAAGSSTLP